MGWVTKNTKRWELKQLSWTCLSILLVPFPIHPIAMMIQASKSKVRSWFALSFVLLTIQAALTYSFVFFIGSSVQGIFITLLAFFASYIVGNGLLLNQAKPYLLRMEQKQFRELNWINSIADQRRLAQQRLEIETMDSFINKLLFYKKEIKNRNIQRYTEQTIRLMNVFQDKDRLEAEKFISRHGTVLRVLLEYNNLERAELYNSITNESKSKLESVLKQAVEAMEVDISMLIRNQFLDISVESDVYLQLLKNKNLLKN